MAHVVDYGQVAEDHRSLLVLVRMVGAEIQPECFNRVFERISQVRSVYIQAQKREISVRYRRNYSVEANSWGDFQGHRKVLGLLTIGKCRDRTQLLNVFDDYRHLKEEYSPTVINSSLVVYGLNADGSPIAAPIAAPEETGGSGEKGKDTLSASSEDSGQGTSSHDSITQADVSSLPGQDKDLQSHLKLDDGSDVNSLSSSTELPSPSTPSSSSPSVSTPSTPSPPVKSKTPHNLSSGNENSGDKKSSPQHSNTNNNNTGKKKSSRKSASNGVVLKVKPDASSQSLNVAGLRAGPGLPRETAGPEVVYYPNLDTCQDLEDRVLEFVTSLYYVLEGKRLDRSFERGDRGLPLCAPYEKNNFVGVDTDSKSFKKKSMGRLRKHLGDLCLQASMPGDAVLHYNTALDLLRSVNDFLWMAGCLEGLCCASVILSAPKTVGGMKRNLSFQNTRGSPSTDTKLRAGSGYANGLEAPPDISSSIGSPQIINVEDVVEKYKEAISLYSKFVAAASIELEACLKASRFLLAHRKYLQVSDFLQNVVYLNYSSQEDDKILRNTTLATLYNQIGFKRKAAFFMRVAAMHCVAPDTVPSWSMCYDLLLKCLAGYSLGTDPREIPRDKPRGWPALQYRVLNEVIFSARKMANPQVAVRHLTMLLDTLLPHLSETEQREMLLNLTNMTSKVPGTTQAIALDSGLILPPVPLLSLPTVRSFKLLAPSPHLAPVKLPSGGLGSLKATGGGDSTAGVFLYTPLSMSNRKADHSKPDFKWVCGDMCEASLQLFNPLVDELKMFYMGLMASDVEAEVLPANPTLPADSGLVTIKLMVKPKASGIMKVLGYTSIVFGVKSNCRLRDLRDLQPSPLGEIDVEVIPALPIVTLTCSLPKAMTFTNVGTSPGSSNDVVASGAAVLFAGQSTECIVTLKNSSEHSVDALAVRLNSKTSQGLLGEILSWSEENIESQLPMKPGGQLCFSLAINGVSDFLLPGHKTPSDSQTTPGRARTDSEDTVKDKSLEAVLTLQYSGSAGLEAGFSRQCSLALHIDTLPSVYISSWSLQHTDNPNNCRLCLDLTNHSGHQMEINYGQDKPMPLSPLHTKRISIEVSRLDPGQVDLSSEKRTDRVPLQYRNTGGRRAPVNPYSKALASRVDIQWSIASAKAQGKVSIDHLSWTAKQLKLLMATKLHWEVELNQRCFLPSSRFYFRVGEMVEVVILLENNTEEDLPESVLSVEPHQPANPGDMEIPAASFARIGSSAHHIEKISPGTSMKHACSFVFFTTGFYCLSISCKPLDIQQQQQQQQEQQSDWICGLPVRFEIT